jgi:hypothetical protein
MRNVSLQSAMRESQNDATERSVNFIRGRNDAMHYASTTPSQSGGMLETACFAEFARNRYVMMHSMHRAISTLVRSCTRLGLQLYLHSALANAWNSLYRTRRFRSLCATAEKPLGLPARQTTRPKTTGTQGTLGDSATARLLRRIVLQLNCTSALRSTLMVDPGASLPSN